MHNFNKCSLPNFNKISLLDSKFDTTNKFYKDLVKLNDIKSQNGDTKQNDLTVLKNASLLYYEFIMS